jgi:ATP-dependent RNA circularization protein (DNA/RNA ligase family)
MKKYDKILAYYKLKDYGDDNDTVYIEEKLDGGNIRFTYENGKLLFGTRNVEFTNEKDLPKMFKQVFDCIRDKTNSKEYKLQNYVVFGEGLVKHTINYDWENTPKFIGFDIYNKENGRYLNYDDKIKLFKEFGFEYAPLIKKCKVSELSFDEFPKSKYYDGLVEGFVVKNYDKQLFIKCVRPEFKEEHKKTFNGFYKEVECFEDYIINKYCTNARIDKMIYKIRDEKDMELDLPIMKYLPMNMVKDIFEEEFDSIYKYGRKKDKSLNFKKFHSLMNDRCRSRLMFIVNNK